MTDNFFCWSERSTWDRLLDLPEGELNSTQAVRVALLHLYEGLKVFHATRTDDVESYKSQGLLVRQIEELNASARGYARGFNAGVDEATITRAIEQTPFGQQRHICMAVDRRELANGQHFHRYGSEHVFLVLRNLGGQDGFNYLAPLAAIGSPYTLEVVIPWVNVSDYLLNEVAHAVLWNLAQVRVGEESDQRGWVHAQQAPIPAECIVAINPEPQPQ